MKTIEVRRSSMRVKPEKKLSKQGEKLARALAPYLGGSYHAYYSSTARRSRDTLEALGFPTFRKLKPFAPLPGGFDRYEPDLLARQRETGCSFVEGYLAIPKARERLESIGRRCLDEILKIASRLPADGRALVVAHSGVIEATGLAAHPELDPTHVREELRHLEGIAFDVVDGAVSGIRVLRLPGEIVAGLTACQPPKA